MLKSCFPSSPWKDASKLCIVVRMRRKDKPHHIAGMEEASDIIEMMVDKELSLWLGHRDPLDLFWGLCLQIQAPFPDIHFSSCTRASSDDQMNHLLTII